MTNDLVITLGEALDSTSSTLYHNPKLVLEVGKVYRNNLGFIVKLVTRRIRPSGWNNKTFTHYFIDEQGQRYWPNGAALRGNIGGQPSLYHRSLSDPAQKVKVGQRYQMNWKDGGVTKYRVMDVGPKSYEVLWDNGVTCQIQYGCPLNYESVLIS